MAFASWLHNLRRSLNRPPASLGRRCGARPSLERLEDRTVPSTFYVTNTVDNGGVNPDPFAGTGTLRQAIIDANASGGGEIDFAITAQSDAATEGTGYDSVTGVATIKPESDLPEVNKPVVLDGYTQAGASRNTLQIGDNAVLKIQLDGSQVFNLLVIRADDTTVSGLVINRVGIGIWLLGNHDVAKGNFIGTDVSGTQVVPDPVHSSALGIGVNGVNDVIGGTTWDARNIISGMGRITRGGVSVGVGGLGDRVEGNYIGTDASGMIALGNDAADVGVNVSGSDNVIGGMDAGAGNVISGNVWGIHNRGDRTVIQGNLIGTDASGASALSNSEGIFNEGGADLQIGGGDADDGQIDGIVRARNIISGNFIGIDCRSTSGTDIWGNYIGTDITGTHAIGNTFVGVQIFGHTTVGGAEPGQGNLISGNGVGIGVGGHNNHIAGNLIGTDSTGTAVVRNDMGIRVSGATNNVIGVQVINGTVTGARNIISGNSAGIYGLGSGNTVAGNYIGTDITGTQALGNGDGINVRPDGTGNTIGGTTAAERNVISGNYLDGIVVDGRDAPYAANNVIEGNYIGTDYTGTQALGNGPYGGVAIGSGMGTTVRNNVISGNNSSGIIVDRYYSNTAVPSGTVIEGNKIGTDWTGTPALGNSRVGIYIGTSVDTTIGGVTPGAGNTIAYNAREGVYVNSGNGNSILGNSIFANASLGIALNSQNDANDNQAAPVLNSMTVSGGQITITGTLAGYGGQSFRLEFFANPVPTPSYQYQASGPLLEGQTFLGAADVTVAADGSFMATIAAALPTTQPYLTATATRIDPLTNQLTDTSQFAFLPLTASLTGPDTAAAGQPLSLVLSASDPAPGLQALGFTYAMYWGEGSVLTFPIVPGNGDGITASHTYTRAGTYTVLMVAIDANGFTSEIVSHTVTVMVVNQPPTANAGGPYLVVQGGLVQLDASGTTDPDQPNTTLTYQWDLDGDGIYGETGADAARGDEVGMNPTFSADGLAGPATVTVSLRVTDNGGLTSTATAMVQVSNQPLLLPDPCEPGQTALFVGGTLGDDSIVFSPSGNAGDVTVTLNGVSLGTYHPTSRIVAYGNDGNDDIQVAASITLPAWLYGGNGNDRLKGGNGPNVLEGGAGDDLLVGGNGRDLLIGGGGADRMIGNGGDILIGGTTSYDLNEAALCAIMAEWTSSHDYSTRAANLTDTGSGLLSRLNADYFLIQDQTVFNDASTDTLTGSAGSDWFFAGTADKITDLSALDQAFIFGL